MRDKKQKKGEFERDVAQLLRIPCRVTRVTSCLCGFSLCWKQRERNERGGKRRGGQRQAKCDKKDKWDGLSRKCSVS